MRAKLPLLLLTAALVGWFFWPESLPEPSPVVTASPTEAVPFVSDAATLSAARLALPRSSQQLPRGSAGLPLPASRQDLAWERSVPEPGFAEFQRWVQRFDAADVQGRSALTGEGFRLAALRRTAFAQMMREHPARALELAVPITIRRQLPPEILGQLETPIDLSGDLEHFATTPAADRGSQAGAAPVRTEWYEARLGSRQVEAYVTDERREQPSRYGVPIHGYLLDQKIVVRPTAGRLLEPIEVAEARVARGGTALCPTSQQDTQSNGDEAGLLVGNDPHLFCSAAHAALDLEERTAAELQSPAGAEVTAAAGGAASGAEVLAASSHTEGVKTILFIRVDFSDDTSPPVDGAVILPYIANDWAAWSYGRCTVDTANCKTTAILRMPKPAGTSGYNGNSGTLYTDALAAATTAGFTPGNFSFVMVLMDNNTPGFGWAGLGTVGGNKTWIRAEGSTYAAQVATHELGHNLGLNHAQSYVVGGTDPIATGGTTSEYGDPYNTMGDGDVNSPYNARYKLYLNWLHSDEYYTATASGTYRIAAHDKSTATGYRGLKVARTTSQDYCVDYMSERGGSQATYSDNGVQIRWGPTGAGNGKTQILDMTSGSGSGLTDAPLALGKTFADVPNGVYLTTVAKITGATFDSMDVLVNVSDSALPSPWTGGDVGAVGTAGLSSFAGGTFVVNGSGADVWGAADEFHFVKRPLTGDCDLRARVPVQSATNGFAKAGVMLRDGADPGAPHVFINVTPTNGFNFQYRSTLGGACTNVAGPALNAAPNNWVRLTRVGNVLTGYRSADGVAWTQVATATIAMSATINGGLAMTSHADPALGAATFDNVSAVALPSPWQSADVGTVGAAGSAVAAGSVFTVSGSGADIWGAADEFRFVYQSFTGDCDLRARVTSQTNTNAWAKAGVMIRNGTAANAAHAMIVATPGNGFAFQYRSTAGGTSTNVAGPALNTAPNNWVRLVRTGNSFTAYTSANGTTWTAVGSPVSITMGSPISVGLAVDSANDGTLSTATFDNVLVGGPVPSPWVSADVGAVGAAGNAFSNAGTFSVSGSGADIWSTADEFRFVQQPVSGDFDLRARVTSQTNTNGYAKAGVMIRNGTADNVAHAMTVITPSNGTEFQYRSAAAGTSSNVNGPLTNPAPDNWVRLVRSGHSFFSLVSADGLAWTSVGTVNITMGATVNAGLAVCSHADGTLGTATFDYVTLTTLHAPAFTANPVTRPNAAYDVAYTSTLAANATDADGDALTFSKVSGPAWLSVSPDGTLSGTPAQANLGLNSFTVRVADAFGLSADATLNITVTAIISSYWDGTGTSWNLAANWSDNAGAATPNPAVPTSGNKAIFNITSVTTAQTVSLDADQSIAGLTFTSAGAVTLQGGGTNRTLTLGNSGLAINTGAGAVNVGSATSGQNVALAVSANQTWTNASVSLLSVLNGVNLDDNTLTIAGAGQTTFGGVLSGTGGSLSKLDGGTLVLSGANTYTGATTIGAGTVQVGTGGTTGTLGAGNISNNGTLIFNRSDAVTIAQTISGTGALSKIGAGTLTLSGANSYTGGITADGGTVNVSGNQSAATGGWSIGPSSTNATTVNFQAGSLVVVASGKQMRLGNTTASGTAGQVLNVAGTVINNGTLYDGRPGTLNLTSGASWTQGGAMSVNAQGGYSSTLTVNAGASFVYAGSTAVGLNPGSSGSALLTVSGGLFTTGRGFSDTLATGASVSFLLTGGGTLKLSADVPALATTAGTVFNFQLGTGGGLIDTQTFGVALSLPISDVGGQVGALTKLGAGTLTLTGANTYTGDTTVAAGTLQIGSGGATGSVASANLVNNGTLVINRSGSVTISSVISGKGAVVQAGPGTTSLTAANSYTGDTTVTAGTLLLGSPFLADTSAVRLSTGGVLQVAPAATDTIDKLYVNGVLQPPGLWGAVGSGAAHESSLLTGTGLLNVLEGQSPFDAWAAAHGLTGPNAAKNADPDGDGVPNFLEFALDGNPASASSHGLAFSSVQTVNGSPAFTYTIAVRTGATFADFENRQTTTVDGFNYTVEASEDISDWSVSELVTEVIPALTAGLPTPDAGWEYHTFRSGDPATSPQIFMRAQVEAP